MTTGPLVPTPSSGDMILAILGSFPFWLFSWLGYPGQQWLRGLTHFAHGSPLRCLVTNRHCWGLSTPRCPPSRAGGEGHRASTQATCRTRLGLAHRAQRQLPLPRAISYRKRRSTSWVSLLARWTLIPSSAASSRSIRLRTDSVTTRFADIWAPSRSACFLRARGRGRTGRPSRKGRGRLPRYLPRPR